jgi:hypothetical protein
MPQWTPNAKLDAYIDAIAEAFTDGKTEVKQALRLIRKHIKPTQNAQAVALLALRRYVRIGGKKIRANWAWTPEEAERFLRLDSGMLLTIEATKVQNRFAALNPGYSLQVSPLRSLERQVLLWNQNSTVQRAADRLFATMLEELSDDDVYPLPPTGLSVATLRATLHDVPVAPEPTSAVPGTSDHGQMRAVDFVITRGHEIVANIQSSTIWTVWKHGGWEAKLIVAASTTKLVGPLAHPYEPWHWRLIRR